MGRNKVNFSNQNSAKSFSEKTGKPITESTDTKGKTVYTVTVKETNTKSNNYSNERPHHYSDLGSEWNDYCWSADDF